MATEKFPTIINYSIIIPHKNIPELLQRCLDSIPRRDDIQIIVVDDNSNADLVSFTRFPGLDDPRVEIIFDKNENGSGAGHARNLGLDRARGRWLIFADADDFFYHPFFTKALDKYLHAAADMICLSSISVASEDTSRPVPEPGFTMGNKLRSALEQGDLNIIRYGTGVVWGRFIKRDLVVCHNMRFQETTYKNDYYFAILTGSKAREIRLDDKLPIYCYTRRQSSLSVSVSTQAFRERYLVAKDIMRYLYRQHNQIGIVTITTDLLHNWRLLAHSLPLMFYREFPVIFLLSRPLKRKKQALGILLWRSLQGIKSKSSRLVPHKIPYWLYPSLHEQPQESRKNPIPIKQ